MSIAGHVSRRMSERCSHVRLEAKRKALEVLAVSSKAAGYDTNHGTNAHPAGHSPIENNDRFVVNRRGEPAVVIMNVEDFVKRVAPAPKWLEKGPAQSGAVLTSLLGRKLRMKSKLTSVRRRSDPGRWRERLRRCAC